MTHVDPAVLAEYRSRRAVDRRLIGHVHLDRPQGHAVFVGVGAGRGGGVGVAAADVPHARVDDVVGVGERTRRQWRRTRWTRR